MRLSTFEIKSIIDSFYEIFKNGKIYLFGSRVDDNQKGGDIDLFLDVDTDNLYEKKIKFLTILEQKIGEQKIDVVFKKDSSRIIEKEINKNKVELCMDKVIIEKYFNECDNHIQRINEAFDDIKNIIPLNSKNYTNLDKQTVQALDQYIYRFSKLQDTMGDKVFKNILSFYEDNINSYTFLDVLNKLEKIGYLDNSKDWINLRKIRNDIAHQYDDEPEESSLAINNIIAQRDVIITIYKKIKTKYSLELK